MNHDQPFPTESSYLNYLPGVYQQPTAADLLGRYLLAFEQILTGLPGQPGLEQTIDQLFAYFDPDTTPHEFLDWLAGWVALSLRDDWTEEEQRAFLRNIVALYRKRGTKAGLQQMLAIYTRIEVEIEELLQPMQIAVRSTIGLNTMVGETPPHHFIVRIMLTSPDYVDLQRREQIARAIIEQEKPAHTTYDLIVEYPSLQIAVFSTIGKDTLLGG